MRSIGPAEKLPLAVFEVAAKSSECGHEAFGREAASGRFKRVLAQVGVRSLILACLLNNAHPHSSLFTAAWAEKLPPRTVEAMAKSAACVRALFACAGLCHRHKRALAPLGILPVWAVVFCVFVFEVQRRQTRKPVKRA